MEFAARQFARKVLLIHLLVLAVIMASVAVAARGVYRRAREEAINQAIRRQELLAAQTGRGIENYYTAIFSNLDLIRRSDSEPGNMASSKAGPAERAERAERPERQAGRGGPGGPFGAPAAILWNQLKERVSNLFTVSKAKNRVFAGYPKDEIKEAQAAADQVRDWIESVKDTPSISRLLKVDGEWANLVGVPLPGRGGVNIDEKVLLIAVVPIERVESRYLMQVNKDQSVRATLVDETGKVIAAASQMTVGQDLLEDGADPKVKALLQAPLGRDQKRTVLVEGSTQVNGQAVGPRMVTDVPVVIEGKTWRLLLSSPLSDVDGIVQRVFQHALWWSIFVVFAMTATLVSTSTQMIRSRLRIEKLRNELIRKELAEARKIQLAWLPSHGGECGNREIDIAAVNEPASHISGDFYDWFELPDGRTVVTIGDVTGHGMSAAFLMSTTQLLIRNTMMRLADPGRCLKEVNRQLCAQKFNGQFVTVLVVVIDLCGGTMDVATAGHYPPLLADGRSVRPLGIDSQLVLGVDATEDYPTARFDLPEKFTLLMYTDGVLDARSPRGERFTATRLRSAIPADASAAEEVVAAAAAMVRDFRGENDLVDDLTLVAIQGQAVRAAEEVAV